MNDAALIEIIAAAIAESCSEDYTTSIDDVASRWRDDEAKAALAALREHGYVVVLRADLVAVLNGWGIDDPPQGDLEVYKRLCAAYPPQAGEGT